ncbi:hypothetical protein DL240_15690 [Lujinxingia litoralis]|uniref:Sigma-70 family RNA polymerase sigma factor n=1 Tax=Lujinxingia litoralis TaxID=2211119 RepID=A0A328C847_9DELT|nr:sigma-70 family RNA polymerase sigma factor [Lujinxingia litoralis]RAL20758.1 hypothetical protein DL240_15690 [Lujinxingia litoralis]
MNDLRQQLQSLHADAFRWALHQAGERALAEDALQAAYEALLNGSASCTDPRAFKSFLFGVIRNKVRSLRRRQTFWRLASLDLAALRNLPAPPDDLASRDPRAAQLRAALTKLSPRQRDILELVFYHELTLDQAARALNIHPGTARTHYERAKSALRNHLTPTEDACTATTTPR